MKLYSLPTCGPCKTLKKLVEKERLDSLVEVVDDAAQFPFEVRGVPTLETESQGFITGTEPIIKHLRETKENT